MSRSALERLGKTCKLVLSTALLIAATSTLQGCENPDAKGIPPQIGQAEFVATSDKVTNAWKRGFIDFDNDGVTDMVEILSGNGWFNFNLKAKVFPGKFIDVNGQKRLTFLDPIEITNLGLNAFSGTSWSESTEETKIDTAELNADGFGDLVISRFLIQPGWTYEQVNLGFAFAVNNQWNKTFTISNVRVGVERLQNFGLEYNFFQKLMATLSGNSRELLKDLVRRELNKSEDDTFSLVSHINMDWADFDGDGLDDFIMTIEPYSSSDGHIFVWRNLTKKGDTYITISDGPIIKVVKGMFHSNSPSNLDWEQFNKERGADAVLRTFPLGSKQTISFVMNRGGPQGQFELAAPVTLPTILAEGIDWKNLGALGAFKADTLDTTGDGIADVVSFIFRKGKWGYVLHKVETEAPR
jgi:hypothetical protein